MAVLNFTEGSGVADSIYGNSQAPIRMFLEKQSEAFEKKSTLPYLFSMEKSSHWAEKYTGMSSMENFAAVGENGYYPGQGDSTVDAATMKENPELLLVNETWKNQFNVSREMVEDSNLIDFKKRPLAFITSYYRTREHLGAALYASAMRQITGASFNGKTFSAKSADGLTLFNAKHAIASDWASKTGKTPSTGTQSNLFALDFTADTLSEVETAMQNFKDEQGNIVNVTPDTIVIPNNGALKKKVFEVIGADKDPATSNNAFNYQFGRWNVIVNPYINQHYYVTSNANTQPWILLDSEYMKNYSGAVFQTRTDLDVRSVIDDDNDANQWKGYARFTAGFGDWRFAACSVYTPSSGS